MAKETKVKDIDITKTGPQGFRQLQQVNSADFSSEVSPEVREFIEKKRQKAQSFTLYDPYRQAEQEVSSPLSRATYSWGESMFDDTTATEEQFQNLGDIRAENQPWYAQIGAGLAKGAILAGTTFLDGTVGLVLGAGTAINEGRWSGLWDNDFSKAMQSVNEWSEQALPNYYTEAEQEQPWYENIFTANFLGDKFIKNLGFTVGAFYSGGVTAAGLKATKLPQLIGAIANSSKAPAIVTTAVGATVSAVNEGRIEALNNSKDWFELHKAQLDDKYNQRIQDIVYQYQGTEIYDQMIAAETDAYNQAIGKLNEDRLKMGNADLLMNIPILTASNIIQFGKLYANGFKTARKATNIVGKAGEYTAGTTKLGSALAITRGALSEGTEEISQKAASVTAGNYYSTDVNNFYKSKTDPEASQETLSWTKAFAEGINETVNDSSSWEEFFIGTLTGALGMPRFRSMRSKEGGFQSPITFEGGAINEWREYNEKMARENEIANYMNNRINSPEFKNYYQGLIRHNKYQNDMNRAAEEGDEFNFKNAEHAQLISDISMFDNAGRMEDLTTLIDTAFDTSDENLASIVENTTTTLEDGSKVGPFVDKNGNPMYATPEGKQEMIDKLKQNHDEMTSAINEYLKIKDDIDIRTGQQLSDSQLEELTFIQSQINNWKSRRDDMFSQIEKPLREEFDAWDLGELLTKLARSKSSKEFVRNLTPSAITEIVEEILPESDLSEVDKANIISAMDDMIKVQEGINIFNSKLKEYLENPQKQAEDHARADEEAVRQEEKRKSDDLRTSLYNAKNLQEFRSIVDSQDDIENKDRVLNALEAEGNERAKNYRETLQYNNEVRRLINESVAEPQAKQDAIKLLQDQFNNSENLEQIANPNSIYVNNENAFDEASEGDVELSASRFQEAQYTLQKAMSKANNDNRFKDRFSPEYKKPVVKREGTTRGDNRETTGDSGTTTTPIVTSSEGLPTVDTPVGNITIEMVSEENKSTNGRVETPQRPSRDTLNQFYRPAIPELHIEASKEGDFRPFDIVVGEKEKNADFSGIYSYLRDQGAFRYVNEGNLKPGDELGFMMDPDFNETTIFIIDKRNNQVVGSLDESEYSVSRYEGLNNLIDRIKQEYANRENKTGKFIATPTTRVSKVMVGRIPYGNTERSLSEIPNVSSPERKPIFGIIKNGVLTTNGKIDDSLIIKPVDMSQKEGRLYLLIPNGAGKYSPAAVRVKHFNKEEFNLDDITVASTIIGEDIKNAITRLSTSTSQDDVSSAMQDLAQNLYMQDVMVNWFDSRAGSGITISKKVRKPDGTYEKVIIEGKEQIKEDKYNVYFSTSSKSAEIGGISFDVTALEKLGDTSALGVPKDPSLIYNEILNILTKFNLPLQVSTGRINGGAYNNRLINSNILTSNIAEATVRSTWFTTDYFDNEGNLHKAISPASVTPQPKRKVETPVGGTEGAISGTKIIGTSGNVYYVDLKSNTAKNEKGETVVLPETIKWLAWIQDNFGDAQDGSLMVGGKALLPDGRVFDRNTKSYVVGQEAQDVKDTIAGRKKEKEDRVAKSKEVISEIYENQKKIDKTRTDGEFYYILEDDGEFHQYSRVHSRLGSNWVESTKQTEALSQVRLKLSQLVDEPSQFNNYLKFLENKYKISLDGYQGKTDAKSRDVIANIVRDKMSGTSSQRALDAGSAVDSIIRQYFTIKDISKIVRPSNMTESAFIDLITTLNSIKSNMENTGERFLADNIILYQKYPDGTRVAGEVDILSVDKDGNFRIYDVKTSRYSFYDFTDRYGHKVNYFSTPSATQRMSAKDYYTLQLSAYKNLFESQYGVPITKLAILPFVLSYDRENVSGVQKEKGILIDYNPSVNVPLVGNVQTPVDNKPQVLPIFETSLETQNPVDRVLPENSLGNTSVIGYYEKDGKLYKGYVRKVGVIGDIPIYITKERDRGFGREGEMNKSSSYFVILPNGKLVDTKTLSQSDDEAATVIIKALSAKPQKVKDLAAEKTILFDPNTAPVSSAPVSTETPANINQGTTQTGAAYTSQKEQAINNNDEEFEDELDLGSLRKVDESLEAPVWNQEKELAWLSKVLPQLSEQGRVQVVKGLIEVGKKGTLAWGQFDKGIVKLSDIAAEGTTYHEVFHVVFNLLLDEKERQSLYNEAKKLYGEKDDSSLEEDMAESFREYVMTRQSRSLGKKILDFFKELFTKVTHWNSFRPSLISYYRRINEGKYSSSEFKVSTISELRGATTTTTSFDTLSNTIQEALLKKGWTAERFDSISQEERDQAVKCIAF